ncbi:acetylornithine deacetylase [Bacteroidia bacterium]|nr:acetylornithine deacetylase [Bacteroidia bacterium]
MMDPIELLKCIITIPSFSKEEGAVAAFMEVIWAENGYTAHRNGNNVWVVSKHYSAEKPTILLDAHIDTVMPSADWETDPFIPTVVDGKLYGLGSNDTGGSVVSMLTAFLSLDTREQPYNLICLHSAEEENTGAGGIQSIVDELNMQFKIVLALIGEPTGMQAAIAEKGLMVLDCCAKGKAGHAARNEGINAIYEALQDIEWFRNYEFPKKSDLLGSVKMTVTGIQAGTLHNVLPAECAFMVDVRSNEHYSNADILEIVKQHVKSEVKPRSLTLNSSRISEEHVIVRRCKELGRTIYGSPTTSNQAVIPWTSLKIGPGDSARSHTANEYIYEKEIEEGVSIFVKLLDGLKISF